MKTTACACYLCRRSGRPLLVSGATAKPADHSGNAIAERLLRRAAVAGIKLTLKDAREAASRIRGWGVDFIALRSVPSKMRRGVISKETLDWSLNRWQFFGYGPVYGVWPGEPTFWGGSSLWYGWHLANLARAKRAAGKAARVAATAA